MTVLSNTEEFRGFAALLLAAQRTIALYPPGHHRVQEAVRDLYLRLRNLLQHERKLEIATVDNEFVVDKYQQPADGEMLRGLLETLRASKVGKLAFREGLRQWEVQTFLSLISADPETLASRGGIDSALRAEGVEHVSAGPLSVGERTTDTERLLTAWEAYGAGIKATRRLRHSARTRGRIDDLSGAREFIDDIVDVALEETRSLLALHSLKAHDEYSFTHSVNVSLLTLCMARSLEFSDEELRQITLAALLHDIGKERVSEEVLKKPGELDDREWEEMRSHSSEGAKMLAAAPDVGPLATIVAFEHQLAYEQEHPDHGRWPLHLVSEIVCIADVYDALRSVRPYRGEVPPDRALEIMEEELDEKFDEDLFEGFVRMVGYYPPGTCVRLTDGSLAVSYQPNPADPRRPKLLRVRDGRGRPLEPPEDVDLADDGYDDPDAGPDRSDLGIEAVVSTDDAGVDPFDYF